MFRRLGIVAAASAAAVLFVGIASGSPIAGTTYVHVQATSPADLFIDAAYSGPPIFDPWHFSHPLADLGCAFTPANAPAEAASANVTLRIDGWTSGDLFDPNTDAFLGQRDALHAYIGGGVLDASGRRYSIAGTFFDDGTRHVVPGQDYYGAGRVTIGGSAGRVIGNAILYRVVEGGDSWSIDFTHIDTCN